MRNLLLSGTIAAAGTISAASIADERSVVDEPVDALVVYSAGLEAIAVDAKDQGAVRAIRMLVNERLLELPFEVDETIPAAAIQLALQFAMGPWTMQAGVLDNVDGQAAMGDDMPPLYVQWTFHAPDAEAAESMAGRLRATLGELMPLDWQPVQDRPGLQMLEGLEVPIYSGVVEVNGAHSLLIAVNHLAPQAATLGRLDLPAGVRPVMAARFDGRRLQPLLEQVLEDDGPEVAQQLEAIGLLGENAAVISLAMGHGARDSDPSHLAMRYSNYRAIMQESGFLPDSMLTVTDLHRVPADATYAQVTKLNFGSFFNVLRQFGGDEGVEELFNEIEAETGIHPKRDVLDHLGQTAGVYMSETTGGGGFLSMVGFAHLVNPQGMSETLARITGAANQMAEMAAGGYVRFGERTIGEQSITTLMFPGIPVPLELSFAIADDVLYGAASPQALLAAIAQGRAGAGGLPENPRFREIAGDGEGAMQVTFYDTPRALRSGYSVATMAMAALANAARSPMDAQRDPGLIMPLPADLARGVRPAGYVVRLEGNDMVVTGTFDRSLLVTATGTIGVMGGAQALAVPALLAGVALPAIGEARQAAMAARSSVNLRMIYMAMMTYAADHDDRLPPSVNTLVENEYLVDETFQSPLGPAIDGGDDYFFNLSLREFSQSRYPDRQVLGYDRAMLAELGRTAVLFYDGHVQEMQAWELYEVLEHRANEGVDFELPPGW